MMPASERSPGFWSTISVSIIASLVALACQQGIRMAWQVRTLPERVMEWLLLFVPLNLFERGLQQFGANAKDIALVGTFVGMATVLAVVGWLAVRSLDGWLILLVGFAGWLFTMAIVMPVTGAGLFATGLLTNPVLTDAAYLLVFGVYSVVLALGAGALSRLEPRRRRHPQRSASLERRSLPAALAASLASLAPYIVAGA